MIPFDWVGGHAPILASILNYYDYNAIIRHLNDAIDLTLVITENI